MHLPRVFICCVLSLFFMRLKSMQSRHELEKVAAERELIFRRLKEATKQHESAPFYLRPAFTDSTSGLYCATMNRYNRDHYDMFMLNKSWQNDDSSNRTFLNSPIWFTEHTLWNGNTLCDYYIRFHVNAHNAENQVIYSTEDLNGFLTYSVFRDVPCHTTGYSKSDIRSILKVGYKPFCFRKIIQTAAEIRSMYTIPPRAIKEYADQNGPDGLVFSHKETPFLVGHLDRLILTYYYFSRIFGGI